ncbi:alcohol dehydrogenase catalytic domain-containing protein [Kribbella solani]|uniref:alcohol dehydrogenase catalytic domain-containing protein n=1 Tax=Kribbella solani TaxID=236067 RepID=UPI0029B8F676|nr:alcohol dehydrogenase catalytic domain-containing protein [Kribbella solani]MDX2971370.1 alcohol dehydrogenase catalytic domain-containing protein [Kribbella solani]MDX3005450.1 alcohol dehydrogenase catalytic domain-containing protein [Kribbella solani]
MTGTMRAAQVQQAGGPFVVTDVPIPEPGPGQVRIRVHACGICGGDAIPRNALLGTVLPRIPGHEIAGVVDAVGAGVTVWEVGQRVGVGWSGGVDFTCEFCRRGDFTNCVNRKIVGTSYDGGYAEYLVAPQDAVARIPVGLSFEEAAPLMCGGITAFNALRHAQAGPGDTVAVQGVGGVGHLAIQFADKLGFRTVAINRGRAKEKLARQLGADEYIDSTDGDAGTALKALGGAAVVLATVSRAELQSELVKGLRPNGQLIVLEGGDPIEVTGHALTDGRLSVSGWYSGVAQDSEDTLNFAVLKNIRPIIETYPLEQAETAWQNQPTANLRLVLTIQPK